MHLFDQDIAVTQQVPFRFKGSVSGNWSVNGNPDGGYLMAMMGNAILKASQKRSIVILTANFISRCQTGDATVVTEEMGRSRNFDRWQGSLYQDGKERVRAMGTLMAPKGGMKNRHRFSLLLINAWGSRPCPITRCSKAWMSAWNPIAAGRPESDRRN